MVGDPILLNVWTSPEPAMQAAYISAREKTGDNCT